MAEIVDLLEESKDNLDIPVGSDNHTMQIELTHRLLQDLLKAEGQPISLKHVAKPLARENRELIENSLTAQLFTSVRIMIGVGLV